MPVGNGPDIPSYNEEEEKQLRLKEKVDKWWYDLEENYRYELMESYYPDDAYLMNVDEMWRGLDWNDKWDIYRGEHDEAVEVWLMKST